MSSKKRATSSDRRTQILLALIPALVALMAAYWQFVYKPAHSDDSIEYAGRVLDAGTKRAIQGAKVGVESSGVPQIYYSDSEGVFYLKLKGSTTNARLRVEAEGYEPFDRNVSVSRTGIEDIRLTPIAEPTITPTPVPPASPTPKPSVSPTPTPNNVLLNKLEGDAQTIPVGDGKTSSSKPVTPKGSPWAVRRWRGKRPIVG
jgi:hypothetical protein